MAYTPPALNNVDFELSEYTAPALNNVDFSLEVAITVPTATTLPATDITTNSATLKGEVTDDGGESCEVKFRYRKVT